jgi:hypothetical protein
MAGGLLQIIAYGAQDMYLTNDPTITFFKTAYRRHTNFSIETFEFTIQNNPNFGTRNQLTIHQNGDLVSRSYLRLVIPKVIPQEGEKFAWVRRLGHALIKSIDITIGGELIDRQYGTWLDIWYELINKQDDDFGYKKLIGETDRMTSYDSNPTPEYVLMIPLKFWFNRHWGLALPMIGIQYHQVIFRFEFAPIEELFVANSTFIQSGVASTLEFLDAGLMIEYIFLDNAERRRFAMDGHEYLIEQVQFFGEENIMTQKKRMLLDFNHPSKELLWCMRNGNYTSGKEFICYSNKENWTSDILKCAREVLGQSIILLNGPIFETDPYGNRIIISPGEDPPIEGVWEEFEPGAIGTTQNNNIAVINMSINNSIWVNTNSLSIGGYSLTNKIIGTVEIFTSISQNDHDQVESDTTKISNVTTTLTARDMSIPVNKLLDTRIASDNVFIRQFSNYGTLIDGTVNPIQYSLLEFNDYQRFEKRDGDFFNYLQPEMHHSKSPVDGINVYSFAINPEEHQPSGTSNLSKIENIYLTLWIGDSTEKVGLPPLCVINDESLMYVFTWNYNVLRVISGLAGLAYNA